MSPFDKASRMAAQLAPLLTTELIPYFLKRPFSCAMTMAEQSVKAMIPNFMSAVSGASLAKTAPPHPAGAPPSTVVRPRPFAEVDRKRLRVIPEPSSLADDACPEH